ncbi:ROK family protein [Streptacidiphilus sp. MAP5-3]|uniref:ROK family protein n=1 Tax=unclassified Streptacidiphilus TaxID=2643834 RepID=UPI003515CD50
MLEHPAPHPDPDSGLGPGLDPGLDVGASPYPATPFTVIGIDFGGTKTEVALADPHGAVLARERIATLADRGPEQALARAAEAAGRLARASLDRFGVPVAAHAAVAPGIVQADRILLTPNLPGWERIALASRLAEVLGTDAVSVANDVRAGALAELRFGALHGVDPGMYVSLGTGIAAALTTGGRVLAGAHQAAGEIGYMNPGDAPADAVTAGRAPLEEAVAGKGLGERAAELLGVPVTGAELFHSKAPAARELVDETLTVLATALANLAVFVDPQRIVLGGGMMASADVILPRLTELIAAATPFPPELRAARFLQDASLHGAVALALDGLRARPAASARPARPASALSVTSRPGATQ